MKQKILNFILSFALAGFPFWLKAQSTGQPPPYTVCDGYFQVFRIDKQTSLAIDSAYICYGNGQQILPNQCRRQFLMSCYSDDIVFIKQGASTLTMLQTYILYTPPNGVEDTIYHHSFLDYNEYLLDQDSGLYRTKVGTYRLMAETFDNSVGWFTYTLGIITVIPKVEKVWIEAPELCAEDFLQAEQDYHFYIKTDLNLADTMFPAPLTLGPPNCTAYESYQYTLDPAVEFPQQYGLAVTGLQVLRASQLPLSPTYQQYTISYADLSNHINSYPGYPLQITVHYSDQVTQKTLTAPLVIKSPERAEPVSGYMSSSFHLYSDTVTASEVWTPQSNPVAALYGHDMDTLRIEHELRIPKGAALSVEDLVLEFGTAGRVVLEADAGSSDYGSLLQLDNTVLTAFRQCGNEDSMWEGVVVEGNASKTQFPIAPNANGVTSYQGKLVMDHSEISYAHEAIRIWSTDPADWQMTSAGGIVIATDSRFYNNRRSAEFMKYTNFSPVLPNLLFNNASKFSKCRFEIDGNYVGTGPYKFSAFITGWAVRGLQVSGCSFENNGYTGGTTRGIYGNDLGLVVSKNSSTPSKFKNLTVAVEDLYIEGPAGLSVQEAGFTNNIRGIVSQGIAAPSLKDNTLSTSSSWYGFSPSAGIVINTGSGYKVTGNTLDKGAIGVLVSRTGSDPNEVKNNSFSDMGVGGLSNYKNTNSKPNASKGLQFLCNTHDAVNYDIAAMGASAAIDGMAPDQGSAAVPAGNTFYSGSLANINNPANQVGGITYYYNGTQPTIAGNVNRIFTSNPADCEEEDESSGGISYPTNPDGVYRKIAGLLSTTSGEGVSRDSLYYWVDRWESPYGMLLKTDLLMADGEPGAASDLYNTIDDEYEMDEQEEKEFTEYGRALLDIRINLVQNSKSLRQLSAGQVTALEGIAADAKMWAKVRARNWLGLYDGREFDLGILYPQDSSQARYAFEATGTEDNVHAVYPNPVSETLQVYYTTDGAAALTLELYDMMGRKALSVPLSKGINNLDVKNVQAGVYYYKVLEGEQVTLQGKLVKD